MSKYTTEVRYICETLSGFGESKGYEDVDDIVHEAYPKIFKVAKIPMYIGETEQHRTELYEKILKHYYTREIGFETVGLWKMKLNQKMIEIMPYYNKLYESAELEFNPLHDVDVTIEHEGEYEGNEKVDKAESISKNTSRVSDTDEDTTLRHKRTYEQGNDTSSNAVTKQSDNWTLFSDTPEGGITGIQNVESSPDPQTGQLVANAYLTTATRVTNNPDEQTITTTHGTITEQYNADTDRADNRNTHFTEAGSEGIGRMNDDNKDTSGNDSYTNREYGKKGGMSYGKMLTEYRKSLLNIDMMIIDELKGLFMQLW